MSSSLVTDLAALIDEANRVVIFTGAGISTESGIPDFRSPGGVWSKVKPIQFQDFVASQDVRDESWRRRFTGDDTMGKAQPNKGHLSVAKLVQIGKVSHIITQNVDNLHQNSGVPDDKVIELHGNATYAKCLDCGNPYDLRDLALAFKANGTVHDCHECGGIIKSATISFGQAMPEDEMMRAEEATLGCDLFIAIDPQMFNGLPDFLGRVERLEEQVKSGKKAPGVTQIYLPGDPELITRSARIKEGIPLDEKLWQQLTELQG